MTGLGAMMAGGNGRIEPDHEFYPTEPPATETFLAAEGRKIWQLADGHVHEPACGDGAIARILRRHRFHVTAADLVDRGYARGTVGVDFLTWRPIGPAPAIITNPPFSLAKEFVAHALAIGSPFVAMYLKSTWFHAQDRLGLWRDHRPAMIYALTWRTDPYRLGRPTMETIWVVWRKSSRDDWRDAAPYRVLEKVTA